MRVGLFGGSFDPVHYGHIRPVLEALQTADLERVLYLPTAQPPHKPDRDFAPRRLRYAMLELALLPFDPLQVSTRELCSGGGQPSPTYTYDTITHYQQSHPDWDLHLLLGADSYAELHEWHRWQEIVEAVPLVVLMRPGWSKPSPELEPRPRMKSLLEQGRVLSVANRSIEASSSELRLLFASGRKPPQGWMPDPVVELIRKYRLYR